MAAATFGVDVDLLEARYFPTGVGATFAATAADVIAEVAGDVGTVLRGLNTDPAAITEAGSPGAWAWLQATVLKGTAAEVGLRTGAAEVDVVDTWKQEYRERLTDLRRNGNAILSDVTSRTPKLKTIYAFR